MLSSAPRSYRPPHLVLVILTLALIDNRCFGGDATSSTFEPNQTVLPVSPPDRAIVLLESNSVPRFVSMSGQPINWPIEAGFLTSARTQEHANHIVSTVHFRDADIHAEFMTSPEAHGNSGLYMHGHYEMQIYDSFGVDPPTDQDEGSLYRFSKPLLNASRPNGEWQVYDIRYQAPTRDATHQIEKPGTITAWLNGKKVQDGVTFLEPRSPYTPYRHGTTDYLVAIEKKLLATGVGPLFLQDHGSPTKFRNIWIVPRDSLAGEYTPPEEN